MMQTSNSSKRVLLYLLPPVASLDPRLNAANFIEEFLVRLCAGLSAVLRPRRGLCVAARAAQ